MSFISSTAFRKAPALTRSKRRSNTSRGFASRSAITPSGLPIRLIVPVARSEQAAHHLRDRNLASQDITIPIRSIFMTARRERAGRRATNTASRSTTIPIPSIFTITPRKHTGRRPTRTRINERRWTNSASAIAYLRVKSARHSSRSLKAEQAHSSTTGGSIHSRPFASFSQRAPATTASQRPG
jgi:hypothetical protein